LKFFVPTSCFSIPAERIPPAIEAAKNPKNSNPA
jgi:hypothetical protein